MTTFNLLTQIRTHNNRLTTQRDERVDDLPEQFSEDVLRAVATFEWLDSVVTNDAAHIVRDTCAEIMPSREHLGHPAMSVVNQLWRLGRKFEAALVVARIWAEVTDRQRALGMPEWPQDKLIGQLPFNLRADDWTSRDVAELAELISVLTNR
ncbi:Uncharacterised protein [Mycobacteroides abscessus subsp. abscessus]|uniref:hypothetical protein n=1 Tax=Mycobacteroides abscessus TaxID=36809 RepID=UPI0009287FFF|nr:hypothetical protein [Mycobacteroides abscessus]SHQ53173.1 Uncharacterised protein [Mycobacteroides abscessus subsp. abscessus]SHR81262.1 Uncharacterised protein [Mycobacteroides abscessus subsp. abscessus]SLL31045.1 Uncharacterised protein [Mycobacteroides abscessus subsp. abscessus]